MGSFIAGLAAAVLLAAVAIVACDRAHITIVQTDSPSGVHVSSPDARTGPAEKH